MSSRAGATLCEARPAHKPRREIEPRCSRGVLEQRRSSRRGQMAVYTEIGDDELRDFIAAYDIGEVLS
ncbi:MAG TPA: hypothetical protein VM782_18550, partial [Stellaceae bacterium]|nr:hypothetical protein [Stellaceae bacterium]